MNRLKWIGLLSLVGLLHGCGGSDDPPAPAPAPAPPPAAAPDTGAQFDGPFIAGAQARYVLMTNAASDAGALVNPSQDASGAFVRMGTHDLSSTANSAARDISGNAHFALGRWADTSTDRGSYYLVLNSLPSVPTSGAQKVCSDLRTTSMQAASWGAESSSPNGAATANALLRFDASGAHVDLQVTSTIGGHTQVHDLSGTVPPTGTAPTGAFPVPDSYFRSNNPLYTYLGTLVTLGDAGDGDIVLGAIVNVNTATGPYMGSLAMICR